jgi:hypothetical protein
MEKLEKLNYDTVILGGTLEALIHSYVEGLPLIMVNPQIPFYRDVDPLGANKARIWRKLSYYLSYAGLNPIGQKAGSYRLDDDNVVTVFGKTAYKVEIHNKELIRYDQAQNTEKLRVFDYIKIENIQLPDIEIINKININDDFINNFYTMIEGRATEVAAISSLTQKQLNDERYSEVYARLKATEVLKHHGIIGRVEQLKKGCRTHKIKTTTLKREVLFDTQQQEDKILMERKQTKSSLMKKVTDMLGNPYVD